MKIWKLMFVNWLVCLITGAVVGYALTIIFCGAIPGAALSIITAACGWLMSWKVMKILKW